MKLIVIENKVARLNHLIDWIIYIIGYSLILIAISLIFKNTVQIDTSNFGFWCFITSVIIYLLNKTVKPIIFFLTLPLTGMTLGLFYPVINVLILYLTDFILGDKFRVSGFIYVFIVAICISILNILMQEIIIKNFVGRNK